MRVEDIRPEGLVRENLELYAKDVVRLMERSNEFDILFSCPACHKGDYEVDKPVVFTKDGFVHKRCSACGSVFISPRPTREMLLGFYTGAASVRHWATKLYPATEERRRELIFTPRVWEVVAFCKREELEPPKVVLDLGAGAGTFCSELRKVYKDAHVVAVEPSLPLALLCHLRGLPVMVKAVEELEYENGADVVTAFELLEHMCDPYDLLRAAHRALVPGGLLYLTTPNVDGFDIATLGRRSLNFGGPNHLQLLTMRALAGMLDDVGFDVLELDTPGKLDAESVRKAVIDGELDLSGQPFLIDVLHDRWDELGGPFQDFLAEHDMSSHMRGVARRRP